MWYVCTVNLGPDIHDALTVADVGVTVASSTDTVDTPLPVWMLSTLPAAPV